MESLVKDLLWLLIVFGLLGAFALSCLVFDRLVMCAIRALHDLARAGYHIVIHRERSVLLSELEAEQLTSEEGPYRSSLRALDLSSRIWRERSERFNFEGVAERAILRLMPSGLILTLIVVGMNWLTSASVVSGIGSFALMLAAGGRCLWWFQRWWFGNQC